MKLLEVILLIVFLFCVGEACGEEGPLSITFDGKWKPTKPTENAYIHIEVVDNQRLVRIGVNSPGKYEFAAEAPDAGNLFDVFSFKLFVPEGLSPNVELIFHIKDVDFWWYQKLLRKKPVPGKWTDYEVQLYDSAATSHNYPTDKYNWVSKNHHRPFDSTVLRKMREIGITLSVPSPGNGKAAETGVEKFHAGEFILADTSFELNAKEQPELKIVDLDSPRSVPQYEKFEADFDLSRNYYNPFDPGEIDVTAHIKAPSGETFDQPCFYFQNYVRQRDGEYEKLTPVGPPSWKLRIAPLEKGEYTWWIAARDKHSETSTSMMKFTATGPVSTGFVHTSKKDLRYFEFSDGSFFYPIGLSLHCTYDDRFHNVTMGKGLTEVRDHPGDTRNDEGGYIIDKRSYYHTDILDKFGQNGMNATEIWLASWGYEIEWKSDWKGYAGINHYNMENAWRLDLVTNSAQENGVYFNLVLHCHGQFAEGGRRGEDGEFRHHPYNVVNGGFLRGAYGIFNNERAFEYLMKRLRYIVARYGYSQNIFSWEIISETDLTAVGISGRSRNFVLKYTARLKEMDIHNHPVTNHYSNNYATIDHKLMRNMEMDFITGDAYRGWTGRRSPFRFVPLDEYLIPSAEYWNSFGKPGLITEIGCCWFGGPEFALYNDVHQVSWAAWMTHLAGTPFIWWAEYVDDKDLYGHYRAFANYAKGEDKRRRRLKTGTTDITLDGKDKPSLTMVSLTNDKGGYAWIYDIAEYDIQTRTSNDKGIFFEQRDYKPPTFKGVRVSIPGLSAGKYTIEFWDTYSGEVLHTSSLSLTGGDLSVPLPAFRKDIAIKIESAK